MNLNGGFTGTRSFLQNSLESWQWQSGVGMFSRSPPTTQRRTGHPRCTSLVPLGHLKNWDAIWLPLRAWRLTTRSLTVGSTTSETPMGEWRELFYVACQEQHLTAIPTRSAESGGKRPVEVN